jgi:hypothetical protein
MPSTDSTQTSEPSQGFSAGLVEAFAWMVDNPSAEVRGRRATVLAYVLFGFSVFPKAKKVADLLRLQSMADSSFHYLAEELESVSGLRRDLVSYRREAEAGNRETAARAGVFQDAEDSDE